MWNYVVPLAQTTVCHYYERENKASALSVSGTVGVGIHVFNPSTVEGERCLVYQSVPYIENFS